MESNETWLSFLFVVVLLLLLITQSFHPKITNILHNLFNFRYKKIDFTIIIGRFLPSYSLRLLALLLADTLCFLFFA